MHSFTCACAPSWCHSLLSVSIPSLVRSSCSRDPITLITSLLRLPWYVTSFSAPAVKERELVTLLNLVNMALQRIPRIVSDDDGATLLTIIGQTTSLLAEERLAYVLPCTLLLPPHNQPPCIALYCARHIRIWTLCRNIHGYLLKTLQSMAAILASINIPAYASICSGAGELVSGAYV